MDAGAAAVRAAWECRLGRDALDRLVLAHAASAWAPLHWSSRVEGRHAARLAGAGLLEWRGDGPWRLTRLTADGTAAVLRHLADLAEAADDPLEMRALDARIAAATGLGRPAGAGLGSFADRRWLVGGRLVPARAANGLPDFCRRGPDGSARDARTGRAQTAAWLRSQAGGPAPAAAASASAGPTCPGSRRPSRPS
jgi:hypothetical protein